MSPIVDLRTDTSSTPTDAMREAMRAAEVGNDGFAEDPSVNRLEELAAARLGKEAALYAPSGTMANMLGVLSGLEPGEAVLVGARSHIGLHEAFGLTRFGVYPSAVPERAGGPDLGEIEDLLSRRKISDRIRMIALENTHNMNGGTLMRPEGVARYVRLARERGIRLHLDGARIFNAAIALGCDVKTLVEGCDSAMFCLSKGLSAPVGSLLVSDRAAIAKARRIREVLGGQMRQAGVLAAAGIVALEAMIDRLAEDHQKARWLAEQLAAIPGLALDLDKVQTNIVLFDVADLGLPCEGRRSRESSGVGADFVARLKERGVLAIAFNRRLIRCVLYRDVTWDGVRCAAQAMREVAESLRR